MKMINPEKSCILDVGEHRADELSRSGWTPYIEAAPAKRTEPKEDKKPAKRQTTGKGKKK